MTAEATVGSVVRCSLRAMAHLRALVQRVVIALGAICIVSFGLCGGPGASVAVADLTEIASVPGAIIDASPRRILSLTAISPPALNIYDVPARQTTTVPVPDGRTLVDSGRLF